ncbi:hypothetical protein ACHAXA_007634 [Cyclostephanos tholiformis]|uniref:Pre-mRNA processing factor 4 (PRP4)-like domain-containing protein n=1 Tax=Cyclostephanos tholiformis TaxID=382380 RepID=A0ABD3RLB9_9STRA
MSSVPDNNNVEYLELTSDSLAAQRSHRRLLLDLEVRKRAATIDVPTLPGDVRDALRGRGEPVRLFGEDLAAIRDRLRAVVARWEIWSEKLREEKGGEEGGLDDIAMPPPPPSSSSSPRPMAQSGDGGGMAYEEVTETTYTRASMELIEARRTMCIYSLERSRRRLEVERQRRRGMVRWTRGKKRARLFDRELDDDDEGNADGLYNDAGLKEESMLVKKLDEDCERMYKSIRNHALEGSQYGDVRPLSAVCTSSVSSGRGDIDDSTKAPKLIATGGWSGGIKIWNGGDDHCIGSNGEDPTTPGTAPLDLMGAKNVVHEDRIMSIAMRPYCSSITSFEPSSMVATASIDLSAKLFMIKLNEEGNTGDAMDVENLNTNDSKLRYKIVECAHLKGHAARLCSVAFHPTGKYVATTSFDHTWRLWDVEYSSSASGGKELLLQDGHAREVYGVGFHPDGSLVATTDFGGVVQCWDLRTGKSACHFLGHAKRVLCSEFSPNGFQLATAGDDGTIKIWDLRRRRSSASIPAHTNLITQLKFAHSSSSQNGEFLASSSFDGTGKIWSTRDWKLLSVLEGHDGKVMGIDVLDGPCCGIVTCGYDKTLKLWQ